MGLGSDQMVRVLGSVVVRIVGQVNQVMTPGKLRDDPLSQSSNDPMGQCIRSPLGRILFCHIRKRLLSVDPDAAITFS